MPCPEPSAAPAAIERAAIDGAGAILEIDLAAVAANWRDLAGRVGAGVACAGVVKADGYGLGAAPVAAALAAAGCRRFFVATLDEGIALRRHLGAPEIAVLNGLLPGTAAAFIAHRLIPVLNDLGQIAAWQAASRGADRAPPAILHVDTGMSRLGLPPAELAILAAEPGRLAGIPLAAVISHLACADEPGHPLNPAQLAAFAAARRLLPPAPGGLAASSGIFLGPEYHLDLVRPGAALYGVNPLPGHPNPMRQVVRLKGRILQVRDVDRGQGVGYGSSHLMDRPGRIATVGVGYADGWLRAASNRGGGTLGGRQVPVVGRISMDLMTLDVTGIDPELVRPGGLVGLVDEANPVDAVAARAGTIGYEILTSLGRRYHRVYLGGVDRGAGA